MKNPIDFQLERVKRTKNEVEREKLNGEEKIAKIPLNKLYSNNKQMRIMKAYH